MSKRKAEGDLQTGSSFGNDPIPTRNAVPTRTMTPGKITKKLLQLPHRLVDIVNSGSETALRKFVATIFTEDCLMKTPTMETAVHGRQHIAASVESVFMSTPDLVLSVDNIRLEPVDHVSSQCLVFDLMFQGTNIFPDDSPDYYFHEGTMDAMLNTSTIDAATGIAMRSVNQHIQDTFSPFAVRGICTCQWMIRDTIVAAIADDEVEVKDRGGLDEMEMTGSEGLSSPSITTSLLPPSPPSVVPTLAMIYEVHASWRFTAIQAVDNDGKAYAVGQKHIVPVNS